MKTTVIHIRVTDDEKLFAEELSLKVFGKQNTSKLVVKLLREACGNAYLADKELQEFKQAVRNLTGISRNLNQITRLIHMDKKAPDTLTANYLKALLSSVQATQASLTALITATQSRAIRSNND